MGTGHAKLGGNYAPVLLPSREAKKRGYPITLHLDSATRTWIDEFSTSNALAIEEGSGANASEAESKDSECVSNGGNSRITLVVPESTSILRSVTKVTVCEIAEKICGWNVELRQVAFEELKGGKFTEVLAAGTAAVSCCSVFLLTSEPASCLNVILSRVLTCFSPSPHIVGHNSDPLGLVQHARPRPRLWRFDTRAHRSALRAPSRKQREAHRTRRRPNRRTSRTKTV